MTKQQKAARKAVATRKARDAFYKKYGDWSYCDVQDLMTRKDTEPLNPSLAAVLANLNRPGTFRRMALACNF